MEFIKRYRHGDECFIPEYYLFGMSGLLPGRGVINYYDGKNVEFDRNCCVKLCISFYGLLDTLVKEYHSYYTLFTYITEHFYVHHSLSFDSLEFPMYDHQSRYGFHLPK